MTPTRDQSELLCNQNNNLLNDIKITTWTYHECLQKCDGQIEVSYLIEQIVSKPTKVLQSSTESEDDISHRRSLEDYTDDDMYVTILVFVLVGVSALFNFGYAFLTKTSYQSVFSSFNFLQIVLLIPLTEVYLATKVSNLIEVMKPALLSFFYFK